MRALPVAPRNERTAVGDRLRAIRHTRQMTIDQLAQATGLSKGFISRVERDQTSPSVSTLVQLCDVLNVQVGDLFHEPESQFVAADLAPLINLGGNLTEEHLLTPRSENRVQVIRSSIRPGDRGNGGADLYTINTDIETLHVISGRIAFRLNHEVWEMDQGDTITFSGREPHNWEVLDVERGAELLWVLSPAPWSGSS